LKQIFQGKQNFGEQKIGTLPPNTPRGYGPDATYIAHIPSEKGAALGLPQLGVRFLLTATAGMWMERLTSEL